MDARVGEILSILFLHSLLHLLTSSKTLLIPLILLSISVGFYRGTRHKNYQFFGPYPSAHVVRDSLNLLKKIFKVRQCANILCVIFIADFIHTWRAT
jgi:hypothetical protein